MRRSAGIILICSLLLPMTAGYVWLSLEKYMLRRTVKHVILRNTDRDQLEVLAFHKRKLKRQLKWEHDREFEYRGQMYDVVETRETPDSVYYLCWPDHEETNLNDQMQALADRMMQQKRERPTGQMQWYDFFKLAFDIPVFSWSRQEISDDGSRFTPFIFHYISTYPSPSVPPPKVA